VTDLHNMSVPSRTTLTIKRANLGGRRYRIDLASAPKDSRRSVDIDRIRRQLPRDGARCLLPLVSRTHLAAAGKDVDAHFRELCTKALEDLRLPNRLGFFVHEPAGPQDVRVPAAAAIAILAARSGPLYVPGRFEPSLMTIQPVTLFFPCTEADRDD
jgi:hypothetical protein